MGLTLLTRLAAPQGGPGLGLLGVLVIPALSLLFQAPVEGAPTNSVKTDPSDVLPNSAPGPLEPTNHDSSSDQLGGDNATIRQAVSTSTPPSFAVAPRRTTILPESGVGPSVARSQTIATLPPASESTDSSEPTSEELQETSSPPSGNRPDGFTAVVPLTTEPVSSELTTETPEGLSEAGDVLSDETTTVYSREYDAQDGPIKNSLGHQSKDMVNVSQPANYPASTAMPTLSWNHYHAADPKQTEVESLPVEGKSVVQVVMPKSDAHLNAHLISNPEATPDMIFVRYKATRQPPVQANHRSLLNTPVKGFVSSQAREFSLSEEFDFGAISKRDIVRSWRESGGSLDFASELRRSAQKRERCRAYNAAVEVNSILHTDSDGRSVGGSPVFEFVRRGVPHFGDLCNVPDEGPVTEAHPYRPITHVQFSGEKIGEKNVIDHGGHSTRPRERVTIFSSRYMNC